MQGVNDACDSHHGEGVEEVGAQDIADGDVVLPLSDGDDGGRQLWQGGPDGNDGQANDEITDPKLLGDLDGDSKNEIVVGSYGADGSGAVWILWLNLDESLGFQVTRNQKNYSVYVFDCCSIFGCVVHSIVLFFIFCFSPNNACV